MLHPDFSELEEEFGEVIGILNEGRPEAPSERPSEAVWSNIANALTVADSQASGSAFLEDGAAVVDDRSSVGSFDNGSVSSTDAGFQPAPSYVERASAPRTSSLIGKRFAIATAVAAAILLVAVPLSLAVRGDSLDQRAELVALGESTGLGTAELSDRTLDVTIDGLDPLVDADYELWLLDLEGDELEDLISLGTVNEDGTYSIPEDLDLDEFSVVDISIEPKDGNEEHSGNSVLRGPLSDG